MAKELILCPPYKALGIPCESKIHNEEVRPHCGKLRKALQLSEVWFSFLKGSNTTSKQSILMQ
jgi:hypothetical protein